MMTKEDAIKVVEHLEAIAELDPNQIALPATTHSRNAMSVRTMKHRIANGEFKTLKMLRERFGITTWIGEDDGRETNP